MLASIRLASPHCFHPRARHTEAVPQRRRPIAIGALAGCLLAVLLAGLSTVCLAGPPDNKGLLAETAQAAQEITDAETRTDILIQVVKQQALIGDLDGGRATAAMISSRPDKVTALATIVGAQARSGDVDGAKAAARRIAHDMGIPTDSPFAISEVDAAPLYNAILTAQLERGDIAGAKQTAVELLSAFCMQDACARIAVAQARKGDIAGALVMADGLMDFLDTKVYTLTAIASAARKAGDIPAAKRSLDRAKAAYQHLSSRSTQFAAFPLAHVQAEIGDFDGAIATAEGLSNEDDTKVRLLCTITEACFKAGDAAKARQTLERARSASQHVPSYLASTAAGCLAHSDVKIGNVADAKALAEAASNAYDRAWVYEQIGMAQAQVGDVAGARDTADRIAVAGVKDDLWLAIAQAQAKAGDMAGAQDSLDRAKASAAGIHPSNLRHSACQAIAEAQAGCGDAAGAADWARAQQDPLERASALLGVVSGSLSASKP